MTLLSLLYMTLLYIHFNAVVTSLKNTNLATWVYTLCWAVLHFKDFSPIFFVVVVFKCTKRTFTCKHKWHTHRRGDVNGKDGVCSFFFYMWLLEWQYVVFGRVSKTWWTTRV